MAATMYGEPTARATDMIVTIGRHNRFDLHIANF
jgi:hypothetical protein